MSTRYLVISLLVKLLLGAVSVIYLLETWGTFFGTRVQLPWIVSFLVGMLIGEITIPLAFFTWVFDELLMLLQ